MVYKTETVKNEFLQLLEEDDIKYILLSEYLGGIGGDIDIYIPDDCQYKFKKFARKNLLKQKYISKYLNHRFYFFNCSQFRPLRVHVKFEISFYDEDKNIYRIYDDESKVIENAVRSDYGYRPYGYHAILLYTAKCGFLERKELQLKQIENLKKYINLFINEINNTEEINIISEIKNVIQKKSETYTNNHISKDLRKILRPKFPITKDINKYPAKEKEKGLPNFSVLFIGPDGAGKSTLIQELKELMEVPTTILYGGVGKSGWIVQVIYNFREQIKKSYILKRLKMHRLWLHLLFPVEILLRLRRVKKKGRSRLLLIDRYPDFSFKPKAGITLRWVFDKILPEPDIIVLLYSPTDILIKRKPGELSKKDIKKKLSNEKNIADYYRTKGSKFITLNTSDMSIQNCLNVLQEEIWKSEKFRMTVFT